MNKSKVLQKKIKVLFGERAYIKNELNKPFIAERIFKDKDLLQQINAIVHPKVGKHFIKWLNKQNSPYVIKEAAILFENNSNRNYDFIITVVAKEKERINRILNRDNTSEQKIKDIMENQWDDSKKVKLSDFVIQNKSLANTKKQVHSIHQKLLKLSI